MRCGQLSDINADDKKIPDGFVKPTLSSLM